MVVSRIEATRKMIDDAKKSGAWDKWRLSDALYARIGKEYEAAFGKPDDKIVMRANRFYSISGLKRPVQD